MVESLYLKYIPHSFCGFFLGRGGDVGIGVQGEAGGEVAEHTRHGLDIYTALERDGCKGMAEIMKSDLWNTCSCQHSLEHIVDAVR